MTPILIAHRGNLQGPNLKLENKPSYINTALNKGYDIEVDIWYSKGWWLGHDKPQYKISYEWLSDRSHKLWIHCKNITTLGQIVKRNQHGWMGMPNFFFHNTDDCTLTSHGFIWTYPNKKLSISGNTICVLPELGYNGDLKKCYGVCTDYVLKYEKCILN